MKRVLRSVAAFFVGAILSGLGIASADAAAYQWDCGGGFVLMQDDLTCKGLALAMSEFIEAYSTTKRGSVPAGCKRAGVLVAASTGIVGDSLTVDLTERSDGVWGVNTWNCELEAVLADDDSIHGVESMTVQSVLQRVAFWLMAGVLVLSFGAGVIAGQQR